MAMKDTAESCSSRAGVDSSRTHPRRQQQQQQQRHKLEAYAEVLRRLRKAGRPEVLSPSFEDGLLNHFNRLPERWMFHVPSAVAKFSLFVLPEHVWRHLLVDLLILRFHRLGPSTMVLE